MQDDHCSLCPAYQHEDRTFTTKKKKNVAIPYELMIQYICLNTNTEERIKDLQKMKNIQLLSHRRKHPYKFVRERFTKKYPNYGKGIKLDANGELMVIVDGTEEGKAKPDNATAAALAATNDSNTTVFLKSPRLPDKAKEKPPSE